MPATDWITEGAQVAVVTNTYGRLSAEPATVERLTATQIILAGRSDRYRRDNLKRIGDSATSYGPRVDLRPLSDERVQDAIARRHLDSVQSLAAKAGDPNATRAEVVAQLEAIERAAVAARQAIRKLTGKE